MNIIETVTITRLNPDLKGKALEVICKAGEYRGKHNVIVRNVYPYGKKDDERGPSISVVMSNGVTATITQKEIESGDTIVRLLT